MAYIWRNKTGWKENNQQFGCRTAEYFPTKGICSKNIGAPNKKAIKYKLSHIHITAW